MSPSRTHTVSTVAFPLYFVSRSDGRNSVCRTVDCIKGRRDAVVPARVVRRGCELALFLPAKVGNLDCTFCMDCVQACPHDNIALATRVPGLELVDPRRRSGIGWLPRRHDVAALVVIFVFGGLINALGMTAPARAMEQGLVNVIGAQSEGPVLAVLFAIVLIAIPILLLGMAGTLTASLTGTKVSSSLDIVPTSPVSVLGDGAISSSALASAVDRSSSGHSNGGTSDTLPSGNVSSAGVSISSLPGTLPCFE